MKKGQLVDIFHDWQRLDNKIGEGRLERKLSEGLPFILEEMKPERRQKIYSYETWVVDLDGVRQVRKIRKVSRRKARYKREDSMSPIDENDFIIIFGNKVF